MSDWYAGGGGEGQERWKTPREKERQRVGEFKEAKGGRASVGAKMSRAANESESVGCRLRGLKKTVCETMWCNAVWRDASLYTAQ